jgi:hypothetical protein
MVASMMMPSAREVVGVVEQQLHLLPRQRPDRRARLMLDHKRGGVPLMAQISRPVLHVRRLPLPRILASEDLEPPRHRQPGLQRRADSARDRICDPQPASIAAHTDSSG